MLLFSGLSHFVYIFILFVFKEIPYFSSPALRSIGFSPPFLINNKTDNLEQSEISLFCSHHIIDPYSVCDILPKCFTALLLGCNYSSFWICVLPFLLLEGGILSFSCLNFVFLRSNFFLSKSKEFWNFVLLCRVLAIPSSFALWQTL